MNTLTQQQINQYQWQVADGVARIHTGPVFSVDWNNKEHDLSNIEYHTNAADGIYSGEAFEEPRLQVYSNPRNGLKSWVEIEPDIIVNEGGIEQIMREAKANGLVACRIFLRLKPSHLPAVLTTQPGEEWKDRYREVWEFWSVMDDNWRIETKMLLTKDFNTYASKYPKIKTRLTWHLVTPPAEQEAETVEEAAERLYPIEHDGIAGPIANERARFKALGKRGAFKKGFAFAKSTITQKEQRIAELEMEREWMSVCTRLPDLIEGKDYSENVFAVVDGQFEVMCLIRIETEAGYGYCWANCFGDIDGNAEFDDEYDVTHWKPIDRILPTPPQH